MTTREIVILPDAVLRQKCLPITEVNDEIRQLADDMLETMYAAPGIGLAASQIGVLKRIFVVDVAERGEGEEDKKEPRVFINPEITWSSEETAPYQEGCLSIPEIYEEVQRPIAIKVSYLNRDGEACELEADGLLATCIQHELDHLDGVLFIDYLSRLKRDRIMKKFQKAAKMRA
ncbi:peptide deformylase [Pseudovibrio exalbescens]|uniref:peptide deformylase n=1 Tax=Pseudovibrio exalbescens TaxID=197461 RepID=UPI0023661A5F|nr:peptide deformylase [Pseudovibrio exalbescens]MDD7910080.1 peptide deformylase [Pseudovibrio exalbescens]